MITKTDLYKIIEKTFDNSITVNYVNECIVDVIYDQFNDKTKQSVKMLAQHFIKKIIECENEDERKAFIEIIGDIIYNSITEIKKYPEFRLGQVIVNYCNYIGYSITAGTEEDCFYNDNNINKFLDTIWFQIKLLDYYNYEKVTTHEDI